MSKTFYLENEDNSKIETLNNYNFEFNNFCYKHPPTLKDALLDLFLNAGATKDESYKIFKDLDNTCEHKVNTNWNDIKKIYPDVTKEEAKVISSYTYEAERQYEEYNPYKLLNQNLVAENRQSGLKNVKKYFFILLCSLRKLGRSNNGHLFRCIRNKVKLEKDPNNSKFLPYQVGNQKTFWAFTSTSQNRNTAIDFLGDREGTIFELEGYGIYGYDITLFNVCNEDSEILLEPECKYEIKEIIKENGNIIKVICKILSTNYILGDYKYKVR